MLQTHTRSQKESEREFFKMNTRNSRLDTRHTRLAQYITRKSLRLDDTAPLDPNYAKSMNGPELATTISMVDLADMSEPAQQHVAEQDDQSAYCTIGPNVADALRGNTAAVTALASQLVSADKESAALTEEQRQQKVRAVVNDIQRDINSQTNALYAELCYCFFIIFALALSVNENSNYVNLVASFSSASGFSRFLRLILLPSSQVVQISLFAVLAIIQFYIHYTLAAHVRNTLLLHFAQLSLSSTIVFYYLGLGETDDSRKRNFAFAALAAAFGLISILGTVLTIPFFMEEGSLLKRAGNCAKTENRGKVDGLTMGLAYVAIGIFTYFLGVMLWLWYNT